MFILLDTMCSIVSDFENPKSFTWYYTSCSFWIVRESRKLLLLKTFQQIILHESYTESGLAGEISSKIFVASAIANNPQLEEFFSFRTCIIVPESFSSLSKDLWSPFKRFFVIIPSVSWRLSQTWTRPLELNDKTQWLIPSCINWMCSSPTLWKGVSLLYQFKTNCHDAK